MGIPMGDPHSVPVLGETFPLAISLPADYSKGREVKGFAG